MIDFSILPTRLDQILHIAENRCVNMSSSGFLLAVYIRGVRQEGGEGGAGGLPYIRYVKYWTLSSGCIIRSSDCQSLYVRDTGLPTASGNVASMREPLDRSLWWYWIEANAATGGPDAVCVTE